MTGSEAAGPQPLAARLTDVACAVEDFLKETIAVPEGPEAPVWEAMRYAALAPGKRLRPFLAVESGRLFAVPENRLTRLGAAIECVHTYSLVHDDLPAMDDDDLRRGQPATHKRFDEATAILAGDGLLTLAFEILADEATHPDPHSRCRLVAELAGAAGARGMVGGQMIDLALEDAPVELGEISRLQRLKTGALISFCCKAGALIGGATAPAMHALEAYAHDLGLAYQIVDDLLDHEGESAELGKAAAKDAARGKATFIAALGAERAREQAERLTDQAARHLDFFEEKAEPLRQLASFMLQRRH